MESNKRSFYNGWAQLRGIDQPSVKKELCRAIGCSSVSWYQKLRGNRKTLDVEEKEIIERIFAKYGITENIWGDDLCEESKRYR